MSQRDLALFAVTLAIAAGLSCAPAVTKAQRISFIRDAEIEDTIRTFATPVFQAAGLNPSAIKVHLVNDKTLNAFVAGGQQLFLNTGLLMRSANAGQVIGVISHETGHIAGGHLSRTQEAIRNSSAQSIVAFVIGAAAAIGTGRSDIGQAIIAGGSQIGMRSFLHYSRTQEGAADQAAVRFLDATAFSSKGLLEFMEILEDQELLSPKHQDPYVRTHPIARDRIEFLRTHVAQSPYSDKPTPPKLEVMQLRMRAKLHGFLEPLAVTLRRYKETDDSLYSRYARAIAHYRKPDLDNALPLIDGLIAQHPTDPYFHELKGQMLFENGRIAEALEPYETATRLLPHAPLLRTGLARVQLELNEPALLEPAITNLRAVLRKENDSPFLWRQLAIAYGRNGQMGQSALAMAEEGLLKGDTAAARFHAARAQELLPRGSRAWLKAEDVLSASKEEEN